MRNLTPVAAGPCDLRISTERIPPHIQQNIAQAAFLAISRAYQDPDLQAEYRRWRAERARTGGASL